MHKEQKRLPFRRLYNALLSLALMAAATLIGLLFRAVGFPETNIVIVYLLAVLLCARLTTGFAYGLAVSVLATVAFNFFFTAPYHSLQVYDASYWVTFVIMTVVALLTSALTSRVKKSVQEAARREQETQALYALTSRLSETEGTAAIARVTIQSLREVFGLSAVIVWFEDAAGPEESLTRRLKEAGGEALIDGGRSLWPITGRESLLGVLQVPAEEGMLLEKSQKKLLRAMLECTALAVERFRATREQLRYREESEQERYRGNLLRAISQDLRTPLSPGRSGEKVCRPAAQNEMAQFRRGTPHHPPGLCPCYAGKLHPLGATEVRRTGVSGARRGLGAERGISRHHRAGHPAQRGYQPCHSGYVRSLPHPGCHRDALPPAAAGRR